MPIVGFVICGDHANRGSPSVISITVPRRFGGGHLAFANVVPVAAPESIDRTLRTNDERLNRQLWEQAGYPRAPTIAEAVAELATWCPGGSEDA